MQKRRLKKEKASVYEDMANSPYVSWLQKNVGHVSLNKKLILHLGNMKRLLLA